RQHPAFHDSLHPTICAPSYAAEWAWQDERRMKMLCSRFLLRAGRPFARRPTMASLRVQAGVDAAVRAGGAPGLEEKGLGSEKPFFALEGLPIAGDADHGDAW